MRALRVHHHGEPAEVLGLEQVEPPMPEAGQAVLGVEVAALNLPDAMMCRGSYALKPDFPFTPGLDAGGTIIAVGSGVDPALIGLRCTSVPVLPHGGLAQRCIVKADGLYTVPKVVSMRDAVAAQVAFQTAHVSLHHRGGLRSGETLLVLGAAGGVGSAAVELGVLAGARVIAVAGGERKVRVCRALGAHEVVDHRSGSVSEQVMELTDGRGVDLVYDPVGGSAFDQARRCTAVDGRLLLVGFASGERPQLNAAALLFNSQTVIGVYLGAYSRTAHGRGLLQGVHDEIMELLATSRIHPLIDRVIGLADVPLALRDMEARTVTGKVVVEP